MVSPRPISHKMKRNYFSRNNNQASIQNTIDYRFSSLFSRDDVVFVHLFTTSCFLAFPEIAGAYRQIMTLLKRKFPLNRRDTKISFQPNLQTTPLKSLTSHKRKTHKTLFLQQAVIHFIHSKRTPSLAAVKIHYKINNFPLES